MTLLFFDALVHCLNYFALCQTFVSASLFQPVSIINRVVKLQKQTRQNGDNFCYKASTEMAFDTELKHRHSIKKATPRRDISLEKQMSMSNVCLSMTVLGPIQKKTQTRLHSENLFRDLLLSSSGLGPVL